MGWRYLKESAYYSKKLYVLFLVAGNGEKFVFICGGFC